MRFEIVTNGVDWDNAGVVDPNVTTYTLENLKPNTHYWFKVRAAVAGCGYSDYSNIIDAWTKP